MKCNYVKVKRSDTTVSHAVHLNSVIICDVFSQATSTPHAGCKGGAVHISATGFLSLI